MTPPRSHVPRGRDLPGAALVASLVSALTALLIIALLAWQSAEALVEANSRRTQVSIYRDAIATFRLAIQDLVLSGRSFAITGDTAFLTATARADEQLTGALSTLRTAGAAIGAPDRLDWGD